MKKLSMGSYFAWQIAATEAAVGKFQFIEKEHILIGLLSLQKLLMLNPEKAQLSIQDRQNLIIESNAIEKLLREFEIDSTTFRRQLRKKLGYGHYRHSENVIHRSEACKNIFNGAEKLARSSEEMSCLHFFAALMETPKGVIKQVAKSSGIETSSLYDRAISFIGNIKQDYQEQIEVHECERKMPNTTTPYLNRYGRDLIDEARKGKLGPFIGRRKELLQVIQTLARHSKNNPVLVGEAGVGKTAIIEALALRIVERKNSSELDNKTIIELNIGALVGGTTYRGEFEDRLSHILDEVCANPNIIVFIDELHNIIGAGRVQGGMDAANLLKPALARGDLKCIGATTIGEYRRYIETDPALERRFEKIVVSEPSADESLEMLKGIRPKWEKHHSVKITDKALQAAIDLSIRFNVDHQLPDKAIDLVDKAGSRTRVPLLSNWKEEAIHTLGDNNKVYSQREVTEFTIAQVLSEKMDLPLELITGHIDGMEQSRLSELGSFLKRRIIGQDAAINLVSQRLLMSHTCLTKRCGPLGVFLFLGPTGVGKTELSKSLASFFFGSDNNFIRFDMSEFMEEHSISKLIGSPPGYVGYEEEGQLTGRLRTKPYAVVLFDEIEKAHQRVFDLFLQLFDEGRLTDTKGITADARNAIFIMTSNISPGKHVEKIGFGEKNEADIQTTTLQEVKKYFRSELINRINEIVLFESLQEDHIRQILKTMLAEICDNIKIKYHSNLSIGEDVERFIAKAGYNPEYGARELRRVVERLIQTPLSTLIISGNIKKHDNWKAICESEQVSIIPT